MKIIDPTSHDLHGRDLLSVSDLSADEMRYIIGLAHRLKKTRALGGLHERLLAGESIALIFEKPSLRTRTTFEIGAWQLGAHAVYLTDRDIKLGARESVKDVALNLSRWVNGIVARVFAHQTVVELAEHASVPVINALSDLEHPCQVIADLQTVAENLCENPAEPDFSKLKLAFIGDGNNVANSLLLAAGRLGMSMTVACPEGYSPDEKVLAAAQADAANTGAVIEVSHDRDAAVKDAQVLYTDVWTSMGQEEEADKRKAAFQEFQINEDLLKKAATGAIVLHCLPAHRGEEITSGVLDGEQSVAFDQAENRLHAQKAILATLIE